MSEASAGAPLDDPTRLRSMSEGAGKLERMFSFVDLFAGIGGFHATLGAVHGGRAAFASEWDKPAAAVYGRNWGLQPEGDIVPLTDPVVHVPAHDVLAAGFPCQPFSKSGFQRGINETRGTLFFNIMK
ncbi:DNA cytosine methyltransferase, partial [Burkholderia cenocepacia]|uniref:DNA cytosine methyltransferase n=1 Tax=Burkholderia cenocepacia TaxID=95486 RepID=UPI0038CBFB9C